MFETVYIIVADRNNYQGSFNPVVAVFKSYELAERYLNDEMYEKLTDKNGKTYWVDTYNCKHTIIGAVLGDNYYDN